MEFLQLTLWRGKESSSEEIFINSTLIMSIGGGATKVRLTEIQVSNGLLYRVTESVEDVFQKMGRGSLIN